MQREDRAPEKIAGPISTTRPSLSVLTGNGKAPAMKEPALRWNSRRNPPLGKRAGRGCDDGSCRMPASGRPGRCDHLQDRRRGHELSAVSVAEVLSVAPALESRGCCLIEAVLVGAGS